MFGAGWSSPVARQAHNLKVAGSNPAPATSKYTPKASPGALFIGRRGVNEPGGSTQKVVMIHCVVDQQNCQAANAESRLATKVSVSTRLQPGFFVETVAERHAPIPRLAARHSAGAAGEVKA